MKRFLFAAALLGVALVSLAACGGSGAAATPTSAPSSAAAAPAPTDVRVTLSDLKVESSVTSFEKGKTYRITVENKGAMPHEWSIAPRGGMGHDAMMQSISKEQMLPGVKVTLNYAFPADVSGPLEFACHVPGHYEAGMRLDIDVK